MEAEYQVHEVREKIMDRKIGGPNRPEVRIDEGLIADAHKIGREGILTNMVLYDMNKKEAKELASRNLLEYRSTGSAQPGSANPESSTAAETTTEEASGEIGSGESNVRKVRKGNQIMTETITECSRDKLLEVIAAPEIKRTKTD